MRCLAVAVAAVAVVAACTDTGQTTTSATDASPVTTMPGSETTTTTPGTTTPPDTAAATSTTAAGTFDTSTLTEAELFLLVQVCDWATGTGAADTAFLHAAAQSGTLAAPESMIEAILALDPQAHPDDFRAAIAPHCALID